MLLWSLWPTMLASFFWHSPWSSALSVQEAFNHVTAQHKGGRHKRQTSLELGDTKRPFRLNLCENSLGDIGLCLPPTGECKATRGVNIGGCLFSYTQPNGICCQYLPCSVPEVQTPDLDAVLQLGLSNSIGLRTALKSSGDSNALSLSHRVPAEVETCGFRTYKVSSDRRQSRFSVLDRHGQIIGGWKAMWNVPWMLALWIVTGKLGSREVPACGAALISSTHAITAAHCVNDPTLKLVLRGGSNLNVLGHHGAVHIEVSEVRVHPNFNPFNYEHDIALVRFRKPVRFSRNLFPVCLPPPPATLMPDGDPVITDYTDDVVTVHGWGCLREGCRLGVNVPKVLRETSLPVISNELAMCWFQNDSVTDGTREYIPPKLFIVGGVGEAESSSTCQGDSGSPVVRQRRDGTLGKRWEVVGLVSWSKGCGRKFRPTVWTRVETFVDWIITNMSS